MPHVIEPAYPGALGHYVNLGDFYERAQLHTHAGELISLKQRYQAAYARAYQCLRAAQEVRRNGESACQTEAALAKTKKRAKGILSRELKRRKGVRGTLHRRFLGAITCHGRLELGDSLRAQYKRIYEIEDHGGLAGELLRDLQEGVLAAGYNAIACLSADDPNRLAHLVVPELSLAFLTATGTAKKEKRPYRRVRMESMLEREELKLTRPKLRFSKRIAWELTADAIRELEKAKALHDEMEAVYHPFVNFKGIDRLTKELLEEIKALPLPSQAAL